MFIGSRDPRSLARELEKIRLRRLERDPKLLPASAECLRALEIVLSQREKEGLLAAGGHVS